ncbi:ECF RNA polymerase sigma factor SigK [uncultured Cellulomonas sp.]|uniref:ECF RNA polymerase sigma factor SigK n=1 Tax=uncultured Cellulomonas sp. TaxID=189682 RepID=UPI002608E9E7|nr:ECF RNA polymerase sigma factor SigK [uncultured Cellulomonas sp.]
MSTSRDGALDAPADGAPPTTDVLLARAAEGDQHAFAQVYDALSPAVFGTCLSVLRDRDHAAEVTQEVMVELWRTAARFEAERGSARTWALTLAHRRAVDRVRSVQSQRNRDQRALDEQGERPFDVVAEEVEDALDRERVRHCLDGLTPTQHEAVVLAYYGGRTYREVADELAAPLATVKSRIRDGLLRLRDCLGVMVA